MVTTISGDVGIDRVKDGTIDNQVKTIFSAVGNAPVYACRAWVNFNGTGTIAIRASGNVSSITDNGTGDYTINFTTAMPDANYSASAMSEDAPNQASTASVLYGLSSFRFVCTAESNSARYVVDKAYCSVQIIR